MGSSLAWNHGTVQDLMRCTSKYDMYTCTCTVQGEGTKSMDAILTGRENNGSEGHNYATSVQKTLHDN